MEINKWEFPCTIVILVRDHIILYYMIIMGSTTKNVISIIEGLRWGVCAINRRIRILLRFL